MNTTLRCPACNRTLRSVQPLKVATTVVRRACRGCGTRWQAVVAPIPLKLAGATAVSVTWAYVSEPTRKI